MKSGVAFWRALHDVRDIHPCWAHLGGVALAEEDLPRPISNDYRWGGVGTACGCVAVCPSGGATQVGLLLPCLVACRS
jgi:hypothetical protein